MMCLFFFIDPATTEIYTYGHTLSLPDALPIAKAIAGLVAGLKGGERDQVLLGVTGSGKTFTVAHAVQQLGRPALVLAPTKTLAAQLYAELKSFFPENAVEYFVSYYDYYQPEAYVPRRTPYIAKESSINEAINRLRPSPPPPPPARQHGHAPPRT